MPPVVPCALWAQNSQTLVLFCEEELELLWPWCSVSSDYQGHFLVPIKQAAASHRKKLRGCLGLLRKQEEDAKKEHKIQESKSFEVTWKMQKWGAELHSEYEAFEHFLQKEKAVIHARFLVEEKAVENLTEHRSRIRDHITTLINLLSEVTKKYFQADLDLLRGIGSIYNTYEHLKILTLCIHELKQENCTVILHYFVISTFQPNLTFDPETALHKIISQDKKTVIFQNNSICPQNSKVFTLYPAVLSSERFDAGRHFWQVEMRGIGEWSLGVCKDSFPRSILLSPSPSNGCWQIQLWDSIYNTGDLVNLRWIGIFLDYELGEISFYNLNNRSNLYTFTVKCEEKLMLHFSIEPSSNYLLAIGFITDK